MLANFIITLFSEVFSTEKWRYRLQTHIGKHFASSLTKTRANNSIYGSCGIISEHFAAHVFGNCRVDFTQKAATLINEEISQSYFNCFFQSLSLSLSLSFFLTNHHLERTHILPISNRQTAGNLGIHLLLLFVASVFDPIATTVSAEKCGVYCIRHQFECIMELIDKIEFAAFRQWANCSESMA